MFTGIIEAVGTVGSLIRKDNQARMRVDTSPQFTGFEMGESIAVNGVCLTVVDRGEHWFAVDMTTETLSRTSFKQVKEGSRVNLERALTPSKKMSGHFVTGHIDTVKRRSRQSNTVRLMPSTAADPFSIRYGDSSGGCSNRNNTSPGFSSMLTTEATLSMKKVLAASGLSMITW